MTMKKQPVTSNDEQLTDAVAGQDVGITPANIKFSAVNPGETTISYVPGKNWQEGQTLSGRYVKTERVYSNKFKAGKRDASGRIYRDLHTLQDLVNGSYFSIWSVGVLGNFFSQVPADAPVSITYTGLGAEPIKMGQSVPHTFKFSIGEGYHLQRNAISSQQAHPSV